VVGDDSREAAENEKSRLIRLASDLDISGRVRFEGSVPQTQLPLYYSSADVCMMPSYSESFGLVALEAQACGCPVVASDVAGLASVVRHRVTGFLVAGDDPADYSERLGEVLDSPELISDFGRRAAAMAGGYTWERTAARIQSLLARPMSTERIMDRLGGY
jgi:D-inositol-3-phosphate glycosyltransferase